MSRLIFVFLFVVQMNSSFAQDNNNIYLLGQTEDGTKYALQGNWVKDQFGSVFLKNYCLAKIPGKFASDTSRWEKCADYTENGGVLEYEILKRKVIDPNDSSKFLKSTLNKTQDSIVIFKNILSSITVEMEDNLQAFGFYSNQMGVTVELKSLLIDHRKKDEYLLSESQNEIIENKYTPFLSLSTGEVEYSITTSNSFFEPGDMGIINAFSKSFKMTSKNDGSKVLVPVVPIGSQLWMTENLSAENFGNNELIPKYEDWNTWSSLSTSAYFFRDGNKYYNQFALIDNRNICPVGFHVPNELDLVELIKTISPDQRDYIRLKKKNRLDFNEESNDLNLNGLISKDVKLMSKNRSDNEISLPTNEYLLGLNTTNNILIGDQKGINYKMSGIFLPFIYRTPDSKRILSLNYDFFVNDKYDFYSNERKLLPYSTVSNENIVFYTSEKSSKYDNRYIPNIENKIGYAVRCIADK
ncbi:MAG: hypothetical protein FJZ67_07835 [Bacteroidetes bacterium]|nr:hypothetical protein [Bacteroidota bacterium]